MPKMPKQGKTKMNGVINPQYYNFNKFKNGNLMLSKHYKSIEFDHRTWLHVLSWTHWSKLKLKFKKRLLTEDSLTKHKTAKH